MSDSLDKALAEDDEMRRIAACVRAIIGDCVFKPCAFFDDQLDAMTVLWRDCSITERRVDGLLTLLEDTHSESREVIGFILTGVAHRCATYGDRPETAKQIADLVDLALRRVGEAQDAEIARFKAERIGYEMEADRLTADVGRLQGELAQARAETRRETLGEARMALEALPSVREFPAWPVLHAQVLEALRRLRDAGGEG